ncbi:hypothetical protein V8G54_004345 [Vigna mungo]|uniref:Protein kinase domain-containing protein n=1 Tax=Vigna mungo TaxID=3915 RepID=A0AAQ3SF25_VIGMU
MQNGNLHDTLLHRKCPELSNWNTCFSIILNIAKGIHFLHSCYPPVIHDDIKSSNVLLNRDFSSRIGDFGLARLSSEPLRFEIEVLECGRVNNDEEKRKVKEEEVEDFGSVSTHNIFMEEGSLGVEQSPSLEIVAMMAMTSPETGLAVAGASPGFEKDDANKMNGERSFKEILLYIMSKVTN